MNNNTPYYNVNCYIHKIIEISRLVIQTLIISLLTNKFIVQIYVYVLLRVLLSWSSLVQYEFRPNDTHSLSLSLPVKGRESLQFLISKRKWVNTVQYHCLYHNLPLHSASRTTSTNHFLISPYVHNYLFVFLIIIILATTLTGSSKSGQGDELTNIIHFMAYVC